MRLVCDEELHPFYMIARKGQLRGLVSAAASPAASPAAASWLVFCVTIAIRSPAILIGICWGWSNGSGVNLLHDYWRAARAGAAR